MVRMVHAIHGRNGSLKACIPLGVYREDKLLREDGRPLRGNPSFYPALILGVLGKAGRPLTCPEIVRAAGSGCKRQTLIKVRKWARAMAREGQLVRLAGLVGPGPHPRGGGPRYRLP